MAPSSLDALAIGAQHPRGRALLAVRKDSVPGRILIEGSWEHSQLLSTSTGIDTFYYCPEACDQPDEAAKIAARAAQVHRRAKLTDPTVYAASRGLVLTTPVLEFQDIGQAASWLRQHDFDVHLADPAATSSYKTPKYRGRTAFVVGSEGQGLHRQWHEQGFAKVSIPMLGQADSLNVALSAGILLFEARARKDGW